VASVTTWYCLDLKCPDTYLRPGEMVVVRLGSLSFREATYRVGCFDTDPTDPSAKKFYFFRSGGGIEDPDRWKKYYTDIRFMPLDTPEGGVICG
jgi:hypothetical protein